jgi:hypothetical protein
MRGLCAYQKRLPARLSRRRLVSSISTRVRLGQKGSSSQGRGRRKRRNKRIHEFHGRTRLLRAHDPVIPAHRRTHRITTTIDRRYVQRLPTPLRDFIMRYVVRCRTGRMNFRDRLVIGRGCGVRRAQANQPKTSRESPLNGTVFLYEPFHVEFEDSPLAGSGCWGEVGFERILRVRIIATPVLYRGRSERLN